MKKMASVIAILLLAATAFAFTSSVGSGKITASAVVVDRPCYITAVQIKDDGTNALTVNVYDSAAETTSATLLIGSYYIAAGINTTKGWIWQLPRKCERGIYISISGGTGYAIVEYAFN